ncbi:MAG: tRNA lysidine(34) synthetase TilS [Gemmatimonadaceae bacterium]
MRIRSNEEAAVLRDTTLALGSTDHVVLAVSGGLDSMVLMHAACSVRPARHKSLLVATFDHRSGSHSSAATRFVERHAKKLGLKCVMGRATHAMAREHEWREARWTFLRASASQFRGLIATAHTVDDQVETVFMRILRDAGPRGLAGLYAESEVLRPFLNIRRASLVVYALEHRVRYLDDPSNQSRAHLRNRVRHEILPAISRLNPAFPSDLLSIARASAGWRNAMARAVEKIGMPAALGALRVARADLVGYDAESLRTLWPAVAAKAGVIMDRRGTHRLAEFTIKGHTGSSIQLSGGIEVRMFRDHLLIQRWDARRVEIIRRARLRPATARAWARAET